MPALTVEITNTEALKVLQDLQEKHYINILSKRDLSFPAFPGEPITTEEFKDMITRAEHSGSISLKEAKASWARQRKELQKLAK